MNEPSAGQQHDGSLRRLAADVRAARGEQRDAVAHWIAGWGVFFLVVGTLGGIVVIIYAFTSNQPIWLFGGVAILIAVGWLRACCDWASQLLLTLGRIDDQLRK